MTGKSEFLRDREVPVSLVNGAAVVVVQLQGIVGVEMFGVSPDAISVGFADCPNGKAITIPEGTATFAVPTLVAGWKWNVTLLIRKRRNISDMYDKLTSFANMEAGSIPMFPKFDAAEAVLIGETDWNLERIRIWFSRFLDFFGMVGS